MLHIDCISLTARWVPWSVAPYFLAGSLLTARDEDPERSAILGRPRRPEAAGYRRAIRDWSEYGWWRSSRWRPCSG